MILSEAAGRGQGLIGAPETVGSRSPVPGTADGAAQIEFFEFDPLLIAWQLNNALVRGLASREFRHVLPKPAHAGMIISLSRHAIGSRGPGRRLIGRINRPPFRT
jgi:hypothetical protein